MSIFIAIRRHFPQGRAKTNGEESMEKAVPDRHTGGEWKWKQKAKHCTTKYLRKTLENKNIKTILIAVDSFEEESAEIS